jgi:hypothetical protein
MRVVCLLIDCQAGAAVEKLVTIERSMEQNKG